VTIPGGGHGNFTPDQWQRAYYAAIEKFLAAHVPASKPPSSAARQNRSAVDLRLPSANARAVANEVA